MTAPPTAVAMSPARWFQPRETIRTGMGESRYRIAASGVALVDHRGQKGRYEARAYACQYEVHGLAVPLLCRRVRGIWPQRSRRVFTAG